MLACNHRQLLQDPRLDSPVGRRMPEQDGVDGFIHLEILSRLLHAMH